MKFYITLIDKINKIIEYILFVLMIFLVIAVFLQIIGRLPFLSFKVSMLEELSRFDMIAIAYLSGALLVREKRWKLTRVDALPELLKGAPKKIINEAGYVLMLVFAIIILTICPEFVKLGMVQKAPGCGLPIGLFYAIIPVGLVLMVANWLAAGFERWGLVEKC